LSIDALLEPATFLYTMEKLLKDTRDGLDDLSKTAESIDNKEPWEKIAKHAEEEGYTDLAEVMRFAETS